MGRVEIRPFKESPGGKQALEVVIRDREATVADYCKALEEYILKGEYRRSRSPKTNCEGCDICCKERIPLTSVDVMVLKKKAAPELTLRDFLKRYAYIYLEGKAVDITLARDSRGSCLFLDPKTAKCRHYEARPLVCRTYICTPSSPDADELRDLLVNGGEDELVRLWLELEDAVLTIVHEAWEPDIDPEDWRESFWTGKQDYAALKLAEILPAGLWQRLTRSGEKTAEAGGSSSGTGMFPA